MRSGSICLMNFVSGIAIAVIAGLILYYMFGIGGGSVTVVQGRRSGRGWRRLKMIGWLVVAIAAILFADNFPYGGFQNLYADMGLSLFIIGLIVVGVGKIGYGWFRD